MNKQNYENYIQRQLYDIDIKLSKKLTRKELCVCYGVLVELQKTCKNADIQTRINNIQARINKKDENNLSL